MLEIFIGARPTENGHTAEHVRLNRHALTIASSGAGKGACQILPNVLHWQGSLVVVDPKGEAAEFAVSKLPEEQCGTLAVLDPFTYADVPEGFRYRFNPLDLVKDSDDLRMIANGLVMRSANETEPFWNDSAEAVIAGILAFICDTCSPEERHLGTLRTVFRNLQSTSERTAQLSLMRKALGFNGLSVDAANRLEQDGQTVRSILQNVDTATVWLLSDKAQDLLKGGDGLDLHQLKRGTLRLFLVLPPDKLDGYSVFLRLFVRLCLSVMWQKAGTAQKGTACLFLLDEFAALGKINEIRTAALQQGRSYGLHIWPFVIGWGQLESLYGRDGAQDFLASVDAFSAYGVQDNPTSELISNRLGKVTPDDIAPHLQVAATLTEDEERRRERRRLESESKRQIALAEHRQSEKSGQARPFKAPLDFSPPSTAPRGLMAESDILRARVGHPRFPPELIRERTAQTEIEDSTFLAQWMLLETPTRKAWLRPWPHFFDEGKLHELHTEDGKSFDKSANVDPLPPARDLKAEKRDFHEFLGLLALLLLAMILVVGLFELVGDYLRD